WNRATLRPSTLTAFAVPSGTSLSSATFTKVVFGVATALLLSVNARIRRRWSYLQRNALQLLSQSRCLCWCGCRLRSEPGRLEAGTGRDGLTRPIAPTLQRRFEVSAKHEYWYRPRALPDPFHGATGHRNNPHSDKPAPALRRLALSATP